MSINILRYSLFVIAGGQEVDHTFVQFIIYPLTMIGLTFLLVFYCWSFEKNIFLPLAQLEPTDSKMHH